MARLTQHWHRFTITGYGQFPFDMLRYDQCHPIQPSDAVNIQYGCNDHKRSVDVGRWAHSGWVPTKERWRGFGWTVVHHEAMP